MSANTQRQSNSFISSSFFHRVVLFVGFFIVESGLAGSWLISKQTLLFPYYFWIYGSLGKAVLFGVVVLAVLLKDEVARLMIPKWRPIQTLGIFTSILFLFPFFFSANQLLTQTASPIPWTVAAHASLIFAVSTALLSCFPLSFFRQFLTKFKKEMLTASGIGIVFWIGMEKLFSFWPYLSQIVLTAVVWLLSLTHDSVRVLPPLTIQLQEFSVTIGQYCSGIESLLLLSMLYFLIGCIDRKKLRLGRYFLLYATMVAGVMIVNILRVYLIIQAGFIFSPQVAAKFFHTYLGILLFLSYFILTMSMLYPLVIQKTHNTED